VWAIVTVDRLKRYGVSSYISDILCIPAMELGI
jgi:hypothetical protein